MHDLKGKQGQPGGRYLAWQLPATHSGPHQPAANGRQRKINRTLKDLVENVAQGNSSTSVDRRYLASPSRAAHAYQHNPHLDIYWQGRGKNSRPGLWHLLPAQKEEYSRK